MTIHNKASDALLLWRDECGKWSRREMVQGQTLCTYNPDNMTSIPDVTQLTRSVRQEWIKTEFAEDFIRLEALSVVLRKLEVPD